MNFANESTSNTYQITQSYVKSVITSNSYSGGFIGTLIYDADGPEIETPDFTISQSYTSVGFTSESPTFDALVLTAYEINFESVLWNKSALHSQSVWEANIPGVSYGMMKRPLYWSARGFDLNSVWGMNPEIFDGLPVIRENYEGMSFDVACQIQKFPAIKFAKNSSKLTNAAKKTIRAIAVQLLSSSCSNLLLTGHASGKETKKGKKAKIFQLKLSGARALAVSEYLFERLFKVDLTLGLSTGGQGAKKLLNKDKTKKQQAANRRVVISTIS